MCSKSHIRLVNLNARSEMPKMAVEGVCVWYIPCMHVRPPICMCTYVSMYRCTYMCVRICAYVHVYIHA